MMRPIDCLPIVDVDRQATYTRYLRTETMRKLPLPAQIYIVSICCAGIAVCIGASLDIHARTAVPIWEFCIFLLLAIFCGGKKVALLPKSATEDAGSMSLGFVLTFTSMLRFGAMPALLIGGVGCLSGCLYPRRQPFYQLAFNVCLGLFDVGLASITFYMINGHPLQKGDPVTIAAIAAIVVATLLNYSVNTGGVAIVIALCTGQKPFPFWKETFLWTAPSYFAGACISSFAILVFGQQIGFVLLCSSPIFFLTYQSYSVYVSRAQQKQKHIEELQVSQAHLADLYLATIKSLALAIDAKDQYTHQHILRVQRYAVATAKQLGLTGAELEGVNTGALLHDIGKLGVPEYVLLKPGRLTEEEFEKIKKHPEIGAAILDPVEFPWPVLPGVKYHHEKWDGTGYPEGLKGLDIPLVARILAVADVYDALTSTRSYRGAWSHERTLAVIIKDAGTHFDPVIVTAFEQVIDGIVQEMALNGEGPLAPKTPEREITTKSEQAARDIHRASSDLWALYEVAQTLSSSLGLDETLEILARKLEAIFPGGACLFLLRDEAVDTLQVRAAVGVNREFFAESRSLNERCRSLLVLNSRQSYYGDYDNDDLMLKSSPYSQWETLRTAMIVPIVHQGQALGTINLYHTSSTAFTSHDKHLLEMIAERAAMALYNGMLYERTRSQTATDSLTGVFNIRCITEHVEEKCRVAESMREHPAASLHDDHVNSAEFLVPAVSEHVGCEALSYRTEDAFALLCMDLDSFKPINDNFGHQKGDQVLRDLAQIFRKEVEGRGIVGRYGGDEFLVILNTGDAAQAKQFSAALSQAVENYDSGLVHDRLGALRLGVSIGYACFPGDAQDPAGLLSVADNRMYQDKTERKLGNLAGREKHETPSAAEPAKLRLAA
jgi:diguanylate cyclase (GGDEF)-like protein/putative nucleotidyltransferase with HDIG domain